MATSTHHTSASHSHQHVRIADKKQQLDGLGFFNQLTSNLLFDEVEALLPPHRERLFPPTETLSMFLSQVVSQDRSCQNAVDQSAITRLTGQLPLCSTATGGYCRARQRLPFGLVQHLTRITGELIDQKVKDTWRWKERNVRIVDGTAVTLPDTKANQERYPQITNQKPGLGFPICNLVGITCLSSGALLDAAICRYGGKGNDELSLLRSMLKTLKSNDVLLGDAFYASYYLMAALQKNGVDALFEQHGSRKRNTDFRKGRKLGTKDHLITIYRSKYPPSWMTDAEFSALPESLTVRELKVGNKILITTMCCPKYAQKAELKQLYQTRWNIELDIRHIKTTMGMEALSCLTPDMAEKELWVYLLAYNLIRLLMIQSTLIVDIVPRQLSFKHTIQLWLHYTQQVKDDQIRASLLPTLLTMIGERRVGVRKKRFHPRAIKRRRKPYAMLNKPRAELKLELRTNWQ